MPLKLQPKKRVVITGLGVLSSVGVGRENFWAALREGRSGISKIRRFDASSFPCQAAGEISDADFLPLLHTRGIKEKDTRKLSRFTQFCIAASLLAIEDAKFEITEANAEEIGVAIGTSAGGFSLGEEQYPLLVQRGPKGIHTYAVSSIISSDGPSQVSKHLGIKGIATMFSTACASGTDAIGYAADLIKAGKVTAMLAGSAEAPLTPFFLAAFCRVNALSCSNGDPSKAMRPFDRERDGTILSEGGGVVLVEELEHARQRGAHIYAEVLGHGSTSDAYHVLQLAPDGKQAARAIWLALEDAGVTPDEIDYIHAHGSSTPLNDRVETRVIKEVFGPRAYQLHISSIKSMIGHMQGGCAGPEVIAGALTIDQGVIPPTINYEHPDPECDLNYTPNKAIRQDIRTVLVNSFGFGGKNAALVLRRYS